MLSAPAEVPAIDGIFPAGGQRGSEFEVTVMGKFEPWPLQAVCDDGRISFSPQEKEKGKYRVVIPAAVEPGARLVRFFNKEGATAPRQFVVGTLPERTEDGSEPVAIPAGDLPLTINGRL
ncbi:MAG: pre-peptidase, partial [Akkermansiaceae bacterium]|nr:pre-peptidase [Akkermansiaceae bacterium]